MNQNQVEKQNKLSWKRWQSMGKLEVWKTAREGTFQI